MSHLSDFSCFVTSIDDQLLKPIKIIHRVETKIFYFSVDIFKIETFQSRLFCIEIFIQISWHFLTDFTYRHLWKVTSFTEKLLVKWIKSSNLDWDQEIMEIFGKSQ